MGHMRKPSLAAATASQPTPLPKRQLGLVLLVAMMEPLAATIIYPIAVAAVKASGITQSETDVGYYAGMLDGIFFATEAACVLQWSRASDRLGRKPVLCVGLFGVALSQICFGLSTSFWALLFSRAIAGCLSANIAVVKSTLGELLDDTNKAKGFSLLAATWPLASILGPLLGGGLAHPAQHFPRLFDTPFWSAHPFALPCLLAAGFASIIILITTIFLEETLPAKRARPATSAYTLLSNSETSEKPGEQAPTPPIPSVRTLIASRAVRVATLTYACLAGVDLAFLATFVLFANSSVDMGGIDLSERQIGLFLAAYGLCTGLSQGLLFDSLYKRFGVRRLYQILMAIYSVPFFVMPLINAMARAGHDAVSIALLIFMLFPLCIAALTYSTSFLVVNESAGPHVLGAVNGLAQTCISMMRAFAPMAASALYAFLLARDKLLLAHLIFACVALASVGAGALIRSDVHDTAQVTGEEEPMMREGAEEMKELERVKAGSSGST